MIVKEPECPKKVAVIEEQTPCGCPDEVAVVDATPVDDKASYEASPTIVIAPTIVGTPTTSALNDDEDDESLPIDDDEAEITNKPSSINNDSVDQKIKDDVIDDMMDDGSGACNLKGKTVVEKTCTSQGGGGVE